MAYNKKTWVTNEIITTAALNNMENGVKTLDDDILTLSLGIHTDGLAYVFKNNLPIGTGIAFLQGGSGDISGDVDANNNIVLNGFLDDGIYFLKYENTDGSIAEVGKLVIGDPVSEDSIINTYDDIYLDFRYSKTEQGIVDGDKCKGMFSVFVPIEDADGTSKFTLRVENLPIPITTVLSI